MKSLLRLMPYLVGFLVLCSICHADNREKSDADIVRKNDAIIKTVHASSGLIFAVPPYWGEEPIRIGFDELAKHIGKTIEKEVILVVLKDYESIIKRTVAGEIDIGFYGPALYIKTKEVCPELRYLATCIWKTTGKYVYYSYLITRKGSGLLSLDSLKGKSFAFGSKESTGGYMYPRAWMEENGIDLERYFSSIQFLGSHNNVLDAVANGEVDAGTVSPGPLKKKTIKYGEVYNRLRKFGPIPGSVIAASNQISDVTIKKIIEALTTLPPVVMDVKQFDFIGFKPLSDASYDKMRQILHSNRKQDAK